MSSAAARKVLRRITAASTTGQRSGTTRQGTVSPGFLLDESLTLSRTSTQRQTPRPRVWLPPKRARCFKYTPANTNNGNSSGNPVDGEIVRVLCGTTTAELDQLLSSTHHGGRHLSTRKRTPSASLPTSRSASATTSLTRFDVNVLLDGRESQGLVRILTGSHASGPDHGRNKHEDSLDDVASRAAVVATPLADANRRKNINRIIRAPVKITEKWHASKVMLESLVGAAASGGSVSVSSSSLALAPGQVGRTSMAKQSVVHLAGAEVIEEDGETDEVTGTRSQSALNSASTVTAAPHRAPSPSLATVHDLSTSQMASLEDLTFDSRPLPPLNPSVDPPTSHKHHANNRPSRSRPPWSHPQPSLSTSRLFPLPARAPNPFSPLPKPSTARYATIRLGACT
ncbi:hypothetical protein BCR44DRAFT_1191379 [Catenaria anguillulae PL171]|uniref:Uncharacterized protein n=1 Tax=Catenaria anguillulae PL171 TaxID=765915 RepID=A0A1Y2HGU3_9FUNG|nr:hypothetical protein BCR44DRAFT_1191379 [Catenaria anguillulae PL171]